MNKLVFFFLYTLAIILLFAGVEPNLRLLFFAPFLVIAYYNKGLRSCLWLALLCGLIVDLLSSQTRLGTYAFNYCLTTWILYNQKRHFFEDSPTTFPIMTFIFAFISTLMQVALLYIFGQPIELSWDWIKNDLIRLPLYDAFYAGIAYSLPYLFFPKRSKKQSMLY